MSEFVRLLRVARPVWGRLMLAVVLGTCTALAAIGLMAASGYLISRASQQPPILTLTTVIVSVRFFGISRGVFRYLERLVGHDAAFRVLADLRVDVFRRLEVLAPSGLAAYRSGDLLARLVGDVDTFQEFYLRVVPPFGVATVVGVLVVVGEALLVPAAGVAVAVGFVVAAVGVPWVSVRVGQRAERQLTGVRGELSAEVVELLQATPELVASSAADARRAHVDAVDRRVQDTERRVAAGSGVGAGLTVLVGGLTVTACLVLGTMAVRTGQLDGVWLAVVVLTPLTAFELASPLPSAAAQAVRVRAAAQRVFAVVDAPAPVHEPSVPAALPEGPFTIRLEQLGARWPGQSRDAIADVRLEVTPGRRVAIVGPSGSGKSTLANVLLRFLDPRTGSVELNGVDTRNLDGDAVRSVIGLLGQDAHVFDTTLRENVLLARRDASAEQVRAALADAQLLSWAETLPDGLDTFVGEHGAQLSGGQRQRLALARVLLKDFPVVILDEPGEHLDTETADALVADLLDATHGHTTLVISHRLHGLTGLDEIVVLSEGRVIERGSHAELLARGGWYQRTWQRETDVADLLLATAVQA